MLCHTYKGICAKHIPGKDIADKGMLDTFRYAVGAYGFLCQQGEEISKEEWIKRIESFYYKSARRDRVIQAINEVM